MDYGELITRSFEVFWRRRYLWLLGALGGGEAAGNGFGSFGNAGNSFGNPGSNSPPSELSSWLNDALPLLMVLGALLLIFFVVYFIVSSLATGGLVRAAAEHEAERPFGLSEAWAAGRRTFWAIFGLRLLILLFALLAITVVGGLILLGVIAAVNNQIASAVLAFVFAGSALLGLVAIAIAGGIIVTLAVRSIVLEDRSVFSALGRGLSLLSHVLGRTLLVWVISVALAFVVEIVSTLGLVILAIPLAAVAAIVYAAAGLSAALTMVAVLIVVYVIGAVFLGGAMGSYLSIYWTLAFRRLQPAVASATTA